MSQDTSSKRELILAQGAQAFVRDDTSGKVEVYVGPKKTNLESTNKPVVFDRESRKFVECTLQEAIQTFPFAPEGYYMELENPASTQPSHPQINAQSANYELNHGVKEIVRGPKTFPLWPGQVARVIEGHRLRSNQYLLVRVYNPAAAMENWNESVMQPAEGGDGDTDITPEAPPQLTMGQLLVIKGTDVSFYIPPTGIEVVTDGAGQFVRDAETLERLEYVTLLDENGNKRYVIGPEVVFPEPTETFITDGDGNRKQRAVELNNDMGIYLKVIADYTEGDQAFRAGDELFLTGRDQKIYYPREEHAIIRYGDRLVHYGVAIPRGEARYVLDKNTGDVQTVHGPVILLPDPREQVIVRRVLSDDQCGLWYPGNGEALTHNRGLRAVSGQAGRPVEEEQLQDMALEARRGAVPRRGVKAIFDRSETYTQPRTITLDTKYDGAVAVGVWPNYAVRVMNKAGESRTEVGPKNVVLEYDETMQILTLSTGKPKNTDRLLRTVFLQAKHNQVGDIVTIQTADMVDVKVKLSFRVDFEGDPEKWFDVDNYVKLLCDRVRSILRNLGKTVSIDEFSRSYVDLIRDKVLGSTNQETGHRPGYAFNENGMRIYDVEVLKIEIGDEHIADLLTETQHNAVEKAVQLARRQKELETMRRLNEIEQEMLDITAQTDSKRDSIEKEKVARALKLELARLKAERESAAARANASMDAEKERMLLQDEEIKRQTADAEFRREQQKAAADMKLEIERLTEELQVQMTERQVAIRIKELQAEAEALKEKGAAISPQLIAALEAFGQMETVRDVAKAMAPLGIIGGESIAEVLGKLLKGTTLEEVAKNLGVGELAGRTASTRG